MTIWLSTKLNLAPKIFLLVIHLTQVVLVDRLKISAEEK
jgi:hypothetical protein